MNEILSEIRGLRTEVRDMREEVQDIKSSLGFFNDIIEEIGKRMTVFEEKAKKYDTCINELEIAKSTIVSISGVPESKNEDVTQVVLKISQAVGCRIEPTDIDFATRVSSREARAAAAAGRSRHILVKFTRQRLKDDLLAAVRTRRGLTTRDINMPMEDRQLQILLDTSLKDISKKERHIPSALHHWRYIMEAPLAVQYLKKLGDEIVAKSNNIHDRYHLGKLILKQLTEHPDDINQIDATTDEQETNGSMLERSTATARAMTSHGLKVGDVALIMSSNNVDIAVPFLACLYVGVMPMAVDLNINDTDVLQKYVAIGEPKIAFCLPEKVELVVETALALGMNIKVVTLGKDDIEGYDNLSQFMKRNNNDSQNEIYEGVSFDTSETIALMNFSSGTTGSPKAIVQTHRSFISNITCIWYEHKKFPRPTSMALWVSPLLWMSATYTILAGAIFVFPRVQMSAPYSKERAFNLINKYRPSLCMMSVKSARQLMDYSDSLSCDLSCFQTMMIGANPVPSDFVHAIQSLISGKVYNLYGMTEAGSFVLLPCSDAPTGSSGKPLPNIQYKIVDTSTQEELGANKLGELLIRSECLFRAYYKNEEDTKAVFAPGGWFKTGDLFYKDEQDYYYFVERIKLLMQFRSYKLSPTEIEEVILQHPGVLEVAVCGYFQPGDGDLPTAFIIRKKGSEVTAQEIKDLVRDKLEDEKQLRGGVIFVEEIPLTVTNKVDRVKMKELVRTLTRE